MGVSGQGILSETLGRSIVTDDPHTTEWAMAALKRTRTKWGGAGGGNGSARPQANARMTARVEMSGRNGGRWHHIITALDLGPPQGPPDGTKQHGSRDARPARQDDNDDGTGEVGVGGGGRGRVYLVIHSLPSNTAL